nr:asparagine synthase (glutamine-hydrolyzing) [Actinomycetota bacterium]
MCGVAGYADLDGRPADEMLARRMTDLLAHRGPDGAAVRVVSAEATAPTVILGHRRLAIIDLSDEAAQPLANEDGSILVVFNGEIYNFRELRRELEARGHTFRTRSDTEVIVHAYEAYGDDFVSHLDGMFAFALWDGHRRRLILARDRAGKKPLYYAWDGRRLTFASEIKSLRLCPWIDGGIDWERLPELLAFGYVPWPATLHAGICQLPPASVLVLEHDRLVGPRPYWDLRFASEDEARRIGWPEAEDTVRSLLRAAVERRLIADVPLGVLLSGGIDSSAIVALMSSLGSSVRTFTVGIGDEASFDERRFAAMVSRRFKTHHTEVVVRADATELIERILWHVDQPFADSSALPTYLIARAAREHVTVALTGDGGDEVFAGYERFAAALLANRVPAAFLGPLGPVARLLPRTGGYHELRQRVNRFAANPQAPTELRYRNWVSLFDEAALLRVLSPDLRAQMDGLEPFASFDRALREAGSVPLLHRLLHVNFRTYLHDDLLVKTDRMSMANSLEARSPFLDMELAGYLASLPPEMKATPFAMKRLLRRSFEGVLPREIVRRRKHGFGIPVGRWFRGELRAPFEELVLGSGARSAEVLDPSGVRALFGEHLAGEDHGGRLWLLLSLEMWLRTMEGPQRLEPPSEPEVLVWETRSE